MVSKSGWTLLGRRRIGAVDHGERGEVAVVELDLVNTLTGMELKLVRVEEVRTDDRRGCAMALPACVWREVLGLLSGKSHRRSA